MSLINLFRTLSQVYLFYIQGCDLICFNVGRLAGLWCTILIKRSLKSEEVLEADVTYQNSFYNFGF